MIFIATNAVSWCHGMMNKKIGVSKMSEFTIKELPFSWNDKLAELALEDFSMIQRDLPYGICQTIGMALAKLQLMEEQGLEVKE